MNYVSDDLTFTTESEKDFAKGRLPTLSFEMWCEKSGIRHSYFEKPMRSQIFTMKRSSQSEQSKFSILVNELSRRFEVLDGQIDIEEKVAIVNHFTQQLVNSGYTRDQIREIIESGLKGIIRKEEKKLNEKYRYRSSQDTLEIRERKKLTESTNWYKDKKESADYIEDEFSTDSWKEKENNRVWREEKKTRGKKKRKDLNSMEIEGNKKIMSVIFVPHTDKSELAKLWRDKLEAFEKLGSIKLKVVERTGKILIELLRKSNSWSDMDCQRDDCIICKSSKSNEKKGTCKLRNVVYETYCLTCEKKIQSDNKKAALESSLNPKKVSSEGVSKSNQN